MPKEYSQHKIEANKNLRQNKIIYVYIFICVFVCHKARKEYMRKDSYSLREVNNKVTEYM